MIAINEIKENIKCPQFGDLEYGKWGALRLEQREAFKHLIDIVEDLQQENKQLKSTSDVLEENNKLLIQQKAQMYKDLDIAYEKIDKANEILSNILVIKRSDGNYGAVKNTRKKEVYEAICMLNEILETPRRINYNLLGDKENE